METPSTRRSLARLPRATWPKGSPSRQFPGGRPIRERGAAMVEFALILPVFVTLVFGIISYGSMLSYRQALGQAASEAARAAAIVPSGMSAADKGTRAVNALNDSLSSYGVRCSGAVLKEGATTAGSCVIQTRTTCPSDSARSCAIVTIVHRYRDHPLVPTFPGLGITLPEQLTYRAVVEVN